MEYYSYILSFHIMSVISWMAMLFYLPRLFIYHRENADNKDFIKVVKIQEQKLYHFIGVPALWATVLSGGVIIYLNQGLFLTGYWLHTKLFFAFLLIAYHFSLKYIQNRLDEDPYYRSGKALRYWNEIPALLMIVIVIIVINKPF